MQIFFWILAIVISLASGYWVFKADRKRAVPRPWIPAMLRTLVVFFTALLLLAPRLSVTKNQIQKPIILWLQDNSMSIPAALKGDTAVFKKQAENLLDRLEGDYRVIKWGFGEDIQRDTLFDYKQPVTDISEALLKATDLYGQQNLSAIILASDGRYNQGAHPGFLQLPFQGNVYAVALGDSITTKDIRIGNVYVNKTVMLNSQFEIRADILATRCSGYNNNVKLSEVNGEATGSAPIHIVQDRFDKAVSFTLKANKPGLHHYIISMPDADGEENTVNNRKDVFVEVVAEKKKILIAANAPHPDINAIREALSGLDNYELTVHTADNLPSSFADYHVVILHSLPSLNQPVQQLSTTRKAVWFIMGANSNNAAFNSVQDLARLNVNSSNLLNQFAGYNTSFSNFTLPPNIHAVMDKMPPLAVPAGMIDAHPEAEILFSAKDNRSMPLWMLRQGTKPSALLVGEGLWRWRIFEYRHFNSHQVVDEAIRQTVSFLSANVNERPFQVELPKYVWSDHEAVSLNAYLLNANNEQVNTAEVQITIVDSAGNRQKFSFEKSGNAYKLNIGLRSAGTYNHVATTTYNGTNYTASGSFTVQRMPIELMETGADYPLLQSIVQKHNGKVFPHSQLDGLYDSIRANRNIQPVIQTVTETIPLVDWKWYFLLILLLATAEWLLRKYWMAQ